MLPALVPRCMVESPCNGQDHVASISSSRHCTCWELHVVRSTRRRQDYSLSSLYIRTTRLWSSIRTPWPFNAFARWFLLLLCDEYPGGYRSEPRNHPDLPILHGGIWLTWYSCRPMGTSLARHSYTLVGDDNIFWIIAWPRCWRVHDDDPPSELETDRLALLIAGDSTNRAMPLHLHGNLSAHHPVTKGRPDAAQDEELGIAFYA